MKERFTFLQKMAETKSETFKNELKLMLSSDTIGQIEITGRRAIAYYDSQHVNISSKADESIGEAIDDFFTGSAGVKSGFQKIVKQALSGLIGNRSMGATEKHMFFVYPENFAIVRVDVKCYKYSFSKSGLLAKDVENVFIYTMAKSIVDHHTLSVDELLYLVTSMVGKENLDEVKDFITELKSVWAMLESSDKTPQQVLAAAKEHEVSNMLGRLVG